MHKDKIKTSREKIIDLLACGGMKLHELPESWSEREKAQVRRKALEKALGVDLRSFEGYVFDPEIAGRKNCENLIGGISIPLGMAGPIKIKGKYACGEFYLPLATTEGALVASVNRGCKAITLSGGCRVKAVEMGITRAPVFKIKSNFNNQKGKIHLKDSKAIEVWLEENFSQLKKICEQTSKHLILLKTEPFFYKRAVFFRFSFDTGLAMGMNMATFAAFKACQWIEENTNLKLVSLSGNVCCDKKASLLNFYKGRGKQVEAEVFLKEKILSEVLKTKARDFEEVYRLKIKAGSGIAKTVGKNAHIANIAAAIFLSCGQDIAHITEASIGETECKRGKEGILIKVWLPDLPLGVVGGGTGLETQRKCLQILGIEGQKETDSLKLAEIVGSAVLAGEISLISALASNTLAQAHLKLGRGIKI